ncbi:S8 family serine peptidase [Pseudarthrobacter sp. NPDC092439]|uniref:S8 family serine peptidase n=1 Tax=unclassified Pseudarthrobacter TaxID=2647000 RepID=UPI00382A5368
MPQPVRRTVYAALMLPALLVVSTLAGVPARAQDRPAPIADDPTVHTGQGSAADSPETRFVVKFKDSAAPSPKGQLLRTQAYDAVGRRLGVPLQEVRGDSRSLAVATAGKRLTAQDARRVAESLGASPGVEYAEVDTFLRPAAAAPNDSYYELQWNLFEEPGGIRVPGAWERSTGAGQIVAVVDSGMTPHSDLQANVVPGYDFITDDSMSRDGGGRDSNPQDEGDWCGSEKSSWHGTHVAGIIGAATNNSKGVAGIAHGAKIQPLRAMGACGGYMSDISDAVIWAVGGAVPGIPPNATPARVVNLSVGAIAECSATFQNSLNFAAAKGAVVVVAAGNDGRPAADSTPANCDRVITVGSTGRDGARAPYSNYGPAVDISAPGGYMATGVKNGIASTLNTGTTTPAQETYVYMQGTSMAAPHVAGVAALLLAADGTLAPEQVEKTLMGSARALPQKCDVNGCGAGLLDATAALAALPGPPAAPPAPELAPGSAVVQGDAAVGLTLTASEGTWVPAPDAFAYQWTRGGNPIPMATGRTYKTSRLDTLQDLRVVVTGSKPGYAAASSTSPAVRVRPFIDIGFTRVFASEIHWMSARGISNGWAGAGGTRTYRPALAVSRDVMAAFMYRLAGSPAFTPPRVSPFTDVSVGHDFYKEISWLASTGVSRGWAGPNGTRTYRPTLAVSRDVMAAFMYRLAGSPAFTPPAVSPFSDVSVKRVFYKEISWLAAARISGGWSEPDGTKSYRPTSAVSRDVMAAFMYRFAAYTSR